MPMPMGTSREMASPALSLKAPKRIVQGLSIRVEHSAVEGEISLHPDLNNSLGIEENRRLMLQFGNLFCSITLHFSQSENSSELVMSPSFAQKLSLMPGCSYDLYRIGKMLVIGPFIGITLKKEDAPERLNPYIESYPSIGGAILAFRKNGVDFEKGFIHGYMYSPADGQWMEGDYPYPSSILCRTMLNQAFIRRFEGLIGRKVFNNRICSKWSMYVMLRKNRVIRPHLPPSMLFREPKDALLFIKKHPSLYMKPTIGSFGHGIKKAVLSERRITLLEHLYDDGTTTQTEFTPKSFRQFIARSLKPKRYMLQQAINIVSIDNCIIDFRLIIVKDGDGHWREMGLIGRHGRPASIVSNISAGGRAEMGEETIAHACGLQADEAKALRERMSALAHRIVRHLDRTGIHFGNIGIDLAVDANGKLWIVEVNHVNPDHTIALNANNPDLYQRILLANMHYAKRLAGFAKELN